MAAEPYTMELHPSLSLFASVKATAPGIWCKLALLRYSIFPWEMSFWQQANPKDKPHQDTLPSHSSKPLSFCKSFCNLAGGRTCSWMHIIFSALYQHRKNHTVRRGAVKVSTNEVNWRIFIMKQAASQTHPDLRLFTPEDCSCVFTFALSYFSSTSLQGPVPTALCTLGSCLSCSDSQDDAQCDSVVSEVTAGWPGCQTSS